MQVIDVDHKLAIKAEVLRASEGGFQRELNEKRLPLMAADLGGGSICPPIILANIKNKLVVVDGQHRLAAWKLKPFPLKAMIVNLNDQKEAAMAFTKINTTQKRVARGIILMISDDPYAAEVRRLAKKYNMSLQQADGITAGLNGTRTITIGNQSPLDRERAALAELLATTWTRDKRFTDPNSGIFAKQGTLKLIARMVRDMRSEKGIVSMIKNLLSLDWGKTGALSYVYGSTTNAQSLMIKEVNRQLDQRISDKE